MPNHSVENRFVPVSVLNVARDVALSVQFLGENVINSGGIAVVQIDSSEAFRVVNAEVVIVLPFEDFEYTSHARV